MFLFYYRDPTCNYTSQQRPIDGGRPYDIYFATSGRMCTVRQDSHMRAHAGMPLATDDYRERERVVISGASHMTTAIARDLCKQFGEVEALRMDKEPQHCSQRCCARVPNGG